MTPRNRTQIRQNTTLVRIFREDLTDLRFMFPRMTTDANRLTALMDTNMRARAELRLNRFRQNVIGQDIGILNVKKRIRFKKK